MSPNGRLCSGSSHPPPAPMESGSSSGSQYALCALGVGLVALGVVMIVWSVVPSGAAPNSSQANNAGAAEAKGKTSSVAFVLVGAGGAMLLLAICLGVRNKQRQQQALDGRFRDPAAAQQGGARTDLSAPSYDVPSYEEVVGSGQYPVTQSNLRLSSSHLPSYEDFLNAKEELELEDEVIQDERPAGPVDAQPPGRAARGKLLPLKVRRIKSEKLELRNGPPQQSVTIEPLTPPPQYEEKVPGL